jgi:hypothetical protein
LNTQLKDKFIEQYTEWSANQVSIQIKAGTEPESVRLDTGQKTLKPFVVNWFHWAWRSLCDGGVKVIRCRSVIIVKYSLAKRYEREEAKSGRPKGQRFTKSSGKKECLPTPVRLREKRRRIESNG